MGQSTGRRHHLNTKNPSDHTLFNLTAQYRDPTLTQILDSEKFLNLSIDPASSRYVVTYLSKTPSSSP